MKKTSLILSILLLLFAGGIWADDEFCPNSKITCPKDSPSCIEKFWSENVNLMDKITSDVKKTLPVNALGVTTWDGFKWVDVMYETESRRVNFIYTTDNDERALEVLSGEYSGYFNTLNKCTEEKGLLCIVPGLTIRMVTYGENKKAINVKNYSREICRARGLK